MHVRAEDWRIQPHTNTQTHTHTHQKCKFSKTSLTQGNENVHLHCPLDRVFFKDPGGVQPPGWKKGGRLAGGREAGTPPGGSPQGKRAIFSLEKGDFSNFSALRAGQTLGGGGPGPRLEGGRESGGREAGPPP